MLCNTSEWEAPLYRHTFKLTKLQKSKSVKNHNPPKLQIVAGKSHMPAQGPQELSWGQRRKEGPPLYTMLVPGG